MIPTKVKTQPTTDDNDDHHHQFNVDAMASQAILKILLQQWNNVYVTCDKQKPIGKIYPCNSVFGFTTVVAPSIQASYDD